MLLAGIAENNIDSPLHLSDRLVKTIKVSQLTNVSLTSETWVPMAFTASSSSFWRRPVMKT